MASFETMIQMNENAYRAPEKMQPSKAGRKPLGDVTNSSKLRSKNKSSVKNFNSIKTQEKVQPSKVGRKPLGDLTNSNKPRAFEKSSKKNCIENLAVVNEEKDISWVAKEGFLHNHNECIKAQKRSLDMSFDYFLETVALQKDSSVSVCAPRQFQKSESTKLELENHIELDKFEIELMDISSPLTPPAPKSPTLKFPVSPCWSLDGKNDDLSPLKLKESPTRRNSLCHRDQ